MRRLGHKPVGIDQDGLMAARPRRAASLGEQLARRFVDLMSHRFQRRSGWLIIRLRLSRSWAAGRSSYGRTTISSVERHGRIGERVRHGRDAAG